VALVGWRLIPAPGEDAGGGAAAPYLAELRRYVDLLQGKIDFTSEEGTGSAFTITIPVT
jgi:sensor histidine kinase regulating citrate/malate metabolism